VIEITNVEKRYGEVHALGGVSFSVQPGEVFGLLGHNGAGKSTLAKILVGLLRPDTGHATICGHDVVTESQQARSKFGYLAEESILYEELTAREHLELIGALRGVDGVALRQRCQRLLGFLDLEHAADREVGTFSRGMRRKTSIAMSIIGDPEAILFDEPTGGLDPDGARRFAEVLEELRRRGRTVIVQSHILGLVEKRCDRIGVLERGKLVACGTLPDLREQAGLPEADLEDLLVALTGRERKDAHGLLE
jgi:ABC-type multidrug transport system ATPase subunit